MSRFSSDEKTCAKCGLRALFFVMELTDAKDPGKPRRRGELAVWTCRAHDACATRAAARQP